MRDIGERVLNKFVPRLEYRAELPRSTPRSRTDFKNPERRFGIASRYDSVHRIKEDSGGRVGDRLIAVERVEQIFTGWSSERQPNSILSLRRP